MTPEEFERILDATTERLNAEVLANKGAYAHGEPKAFEKRVYEVLQEVAAGQNIKIAPSFHPHAFPDITANGFGVEVKSTNKDSWLSVGNSIFEGMRDESVERIYVMFGKFGGMPSVRWGRYEERITHVRISHAPRFVLEMDRDSSLFGHMNISYDEFSALTPEEKMKYVRDYSRGRLRQGERLWWLEDMPGEEKTLPIEVRLYMYLEQDEKRRLRAEGALLCPQIVRGSRVKNKYNDVALYFLTYHGVFCPQTRDLYSAGSVALKASSVRGGNYLLRALLDIENEMREAAFRLDHALFEEYWGHSVPPRERLAEWLRMADAYAKDWTPSEHLFLTR